MVMDINLPRPSGESNSHRSSINEGDEDFEDLYEKNGLLEQRSSRARHSNRWIPNSWFNVLVSLNAGFSLLLVLGFLSLARQKSNSISGDSPVPPYSPLREDGVVRYINTQYKPMKEFRSSNPEVDEAWDSWLREHDHLVLIPKEKAVSSGLPESADAFLDPGYVPYGLAVYHQMHCLNRIRRTFHADRWFPNDTAEKIEFHRDHCFDMIRQSLLCHGDVSLLYWWNGNYSYVDEAGARHYTEEYLRKTPEQRATGTFAMWDTPVQCRDMNAIHTWAKAHQIDDDKYGGQEID